jgi:hypothetical protein
MSQKAALVVILLVIALVLFLAVRTDIADAQSGSCNWSTDHAWHWSPAYSLYYEYIGQTWRDGHSYRTFLLSNVAGCPRQCNVAYIYCG